MAVCRTFFVNAKKRIARQGLCLPSGITLTEEQIEKVCEAVKKVLGDR